MIGQYGALGWVNPTLSSRRSGISAYGHHRKSSLLLNDKLRWNSVVLLIGGKCRHLNSTYFWSDVNRTYFQNRYIISSMQQVHCKKACISICAANHGGRPKWARMIACPYDFQCPRHAIITGYSSVDNENSKKKGFYYVIMEHVSGLHPVLCHYYSLPLRIYSTLSRISHWGHRHMKSWNGHSIYDQKFSKPWLNDRILGLFSWESFP